MFFLNWRKNLRKNEEIKEGEKQQTYKTFYSIEEVKTYLEQKLQYSSDLVTRIVQVEKAKIGFFYLENLVDSNVLNDHILQPILLIDDKPILLEELTHKISVGQIKVTSDPEQILNSIIRGWVFIFLEGTSQGLLVGASGMKGSGRSPAKAENESYVMGPQVGFVESLATNMAFLRGYITDPMLTNETLEVGKVTRTAVQLIYIKGIANEQNVNTVRQRIESLEMDEMLDSSILAQVLEDNSMSVFPQLLLTERPDRVSSKLLEGKIAILVDGSPYAIVCPTTFVEYFQSTEDQYLRWNMGSLLRLLRAFAMFLSVLFTPAYVAALTFHYEVIPQKLLVPLGQSRSQVPFPPLFEALLLETLIEFLREAGARLPTKVGQTMGIVGGIVIGQAAVQAGFTSNILIMIVALGALSSFTAPSYMMGAAIRIVRFPIIILAGIWGGIGIMFGLTFLIIHLLRQTSMGSPYLSPIYPFRFNDFKDSLVRFPIPFLSKRPTFARAKDKGKFNRKRAMEKADIDE